MQSLSYFMPSLLGKVLSECEADEVVVIYCSFLPHPSLLLRFSLRLGHARGLTVHRTVIQRPCAASLRQKTLSTLLACSLCTLYITIITTANAPPSRSAETTLIFFSASSLSSVSSELISSRSSLRFESSPSLYPEPRP